VAASKLTARLREQRASAVGMASAAAATADVQRRRESGALLSARMAQHSLTAAIYGRRAGGGAGGWRDTDSDDGAVAAELADAARAVRNEEALAASGIGPGCQRGGAAVPPTGGYASAAIQPHAVPQLQAHRLPIPARLRNDAQTGRYVAAAAGTKSPYHYLPLGDVLELERRPQPSLAGAKPARGAASGVRPPPSPATREPGTGDAGDDDGDAATPEPALVGVALLALGALRGGAPGPGSSRSGTLSGRAPASGRRAGHTARASVQAATLGTAQAAVAARVAAAGVVQRQAGR
jgi:hypothetical protein